MTPTNGPTPRSASAPDGTRPLPGPPGADAATVTVARLTDLTDELHKADHAPLEERAAALAAIHETLVSQLREAED